VNVDMLKTGEENESRRIKEIRRREKK